MNADIQRQLESRIAAFAADVTRILQDAVAAGVANALAHRPNAATAPSARSGKRAAGRAVSPDAVLAALKKKPSQRIEELAVALDTSTRQVKKSLLVLAEAKKIKRTGQARGTRYQLR